MCGIVGFWNREDEAAEEAILYRMLKRIEYRGPDDAGVWTDGAVGFGQVRLSILDLSPRGHQPFETADGLGVISYNGEVYNFRELRANLESEGVVFKSSTDTEVVLYALHKWGPKRALPLFNGMFGFAYFDKRSKTLWLARDRTGIKPLYFTRQGNLFAFASEMKALLAHPKVVTKPDILTLAHFVMHQRIEGDWTPFEDIEQLTAGSYLEITSHDIQRTVYFDVLRDFDPERILENAKRSDEALNREFESTLSESVRMHLVSDAPLAVMCSGGVDSSLTTALARDFKPDVVAYVANVKDTLSEGENAQKVGRHLGIKIRQIDVDRKDLVRLWPTAIWHGDQPNCHANDMPYMLVTRACREDGIKVVLTGEGSDELFGGYPWQAKAYQMWRPRRMHSEFIPNRPFFRMLRKLHPKLAPFDLAALSKNPFAHRDELEFPQEMLRRTSVIDGGRSLLRHEALFSKLEKIKPLEERAFLARCFEDWYGNLQAVLHRNDRISMAASVEARPPFLENKMMELGMHTPCRMKYRNGMSKWVVKKAAEKKLPYEIVHSRKVHFAVPMNTWRQAAPLLEGGMTAHLFRWGSEETKALLERAKDSPTVIHNLLGVELWARIFLGGESPESLGERLLALSSSHKSVLEPDYSCVAQTV